MEIPLDIQYFWLVLNDPKLYVMAGNGGGKDGGGTGKKTENDFRCLN